MKRLLAILFVALLAAQPVVVGDTLLLKNGDQLKGTVTLESAGQVRLTHDNLGTLDIKSELITGGTVSVTLQDGSTVSGTLVGWSEGHWLVKPKDLPTVSLVVADDGSLSRVVDEPDDAVAAGTEPVGADDEATATRSEEVTEEMREAAKARISAAKKVIADAQKELKTPWTGTISLGGSLSQGTSDAANLLLDVGLTREVPDSKTMIKAFYILNTDGDSTTQNWFQGSIDHSWNFIDKARRWGLFGLAVFDYQEQASWEQRFNANIGAQYLLVDATRDPGSDWFQRLKLRARAGPGIRKEFAGDFTDPALEVLLGGTWDITFLKGVTFTGNAQVYPDLSEIGEFRVTANTSFMVALESLEGVSVGLDLKFQYQSQVDPGQQDYLLVVSGKVQYSF
ncbi:MAG: DUF481 domain-containing protein [Phycisphaerales bacterium]|nr:DUF481 domain-containing protein [Phycisphaerales bacterium]